MTTEIIYGRNSIEEALKAGRRKFFELYLQGRHGQAEDSSFAPLVKKAGVPVRVMPRDDLDDLTKGAKHQGVAAKVVAFPYSDCEALVKKLGPKAFFLMCDTITDPQNLGAICRSAYCFGVDAVIINKDRAVDINATVSKASAGAVEHLNICKETNLTRTLEMLKENGFWSYAADANARDSLHTLDPADKMVFVMGSEGAGIRRLVREHCDIGFSIPMARSFDSLNVAQAATVILYEMAKKRV
jgi:23S rRNA (guanosine2251-2'-O)-methyltransferase